MCMRTCVCVCVCVCVCQLHPQATGECPGDEAMCVYVIEIYVHIKGKMDLKVKEES